MVCPNCGHQLAEGASFCPICGSRVGEARQQPEPTTIPTEGTSLGYGQQSDYGQQSYYGQQGYQEPGDPGRPVSFYYQRQFAAIAEGERGNFNWAAFFLGPYHAIYRGHTGRFLALYLPLLLAAAIDEIGMIAVIGTGQRMLFLVFVLLSWVISIAALVISIYNGFTFNRSYYKACGGDPRVPHHGGRLIAAIITIGVVVMALTFALLGRFVGQVFNQLGEGNYPGSSPFEEILSQDTPDSSSEGQIQQSTGEFGSVEELLEAYSTVARDQLYLLGWGDPDAPDEQSMIRSVYLFNSDDASFLDTLSAASTDLSWETFEPDEPIYQGQAWYYTIYCSLDEGEVAFDLVAGGGNAAVFGCYVRGNKGYTGLDQQQTSALLAALYERAGAPQSLASLVRGSWRTEDGQEFVMDAETLNGKAYTLWYVDNGCLAVYLDGTTEVEWEYYMTVEGDTLNVWQFDDSGEVVSDLYYTRVD